MNTHPKMPVQYLDAIHHVDASNPQQVAAFAATAGATVETVRHWLGVFCCPRMELHRKLHVHVPAMASGFVIQTGAGPLRIAPGRLAERITDLIAQAGRLELMRMDAAADQEGAPQ